MYDAGNFGALLFGGEGSDFTGFVVEGLRAHNCWDGIRPRANSENFTIRNVWISDARDDAIENDHQMPGRVEDSLLEDCHMAVSCGRGASDTSDPVPLSSALS